MLFTSFDFLLLLIATFSLYYIPKLAKVQIPLLVLSSLVFYAYNEIYFVLLLLLSAGINILTSYYVVYGNINKKRLLALTGVILNLTILFFFKYCGMVTSFFLTDSDSIGQLLLHIPLPIGISFFTFEGISLLVDVWKEKYIKNTEIVPQSLSKHAQHTLFFISFFPHLIAGPILKAHDFYPQIKQKFLKDVQWEAVVKALIVGYFLKMVIADNFKDYTYLLDVSERYSTVTLLTMMFGYSFQIFADFAGYSLIAIGLAKLFGYNFQENFNFPYISTSFKDFWKRWHISLSTFLMEYLYFPLGGNRKGKARTYINLMITMTLGGLWHGAAWSYALWGFAHGSLLAIERFLDNNLKLKHNVITKTIHGIFVFLVITILWLLFKYPSIRNFFAFVQSLKNNVGLDNDINIIANIAIFSLPVIVYHIMYLSKGSVVWMAFKKVEHIVYATLLFLIVTNSGSGGSFIYFQF